MRKICIINKGELEKFPPTITLSKLLVKENISVKIICTSCNNGVKNDLEKLNIKILETNDTIKMKWKFGKLETWYKFKKSVWSLLKKDLEEYELWIATADTAMCLGSKLLEQDYFFSILELYDTLPVYKKSLNKYANAAKKVIVPEFCRANIFKVWWSLKERPSIIPNKPDINNIDIDKLEVKLDKNIEDIIFNSNKKCILYQGLINRERDLTTIAKALSNINDNKYVLLLVGTNYDNTVEYLKGIYSNIIHVDFIAYPHYFKITKQAFVGIATYDDSSLNHIFCAPNKIFEYAYLGVPILARDIPGLQYTIGINKAGVCVDTDNVEDIQKGILELEKNYDMYKQNATKYFNSVDLELIIKNIL
ncbi:MAG: glycosyltransferase [Sarcina sp.]